MALNAIMSATVHIFTTLSLRGGRKLNLTSAEIKSIQIFVEKKVELTFEKSVGFRKGQLKKPTHNSIKLNKNGNEFVAKDLSADLYNLFLSRIASGEIVETIQDLIILFSDLH